jgi:Fanconi anemia group M protein
VPLSESTSHNWIFPIDDKYPERSYQLEMAHTSIMTNTLVSLPTGLGKTLVAAVVMYNYYRWFPTGKVIFCAPTRPLVTQQIQACYNIMGIPERHTAEISAKNQPEVRQRIWDTKRVFFCTPQALVNDIKGDRINAKDIVCVVIDEVSVNVKACTRDSSRPTHSKLKMANPFTTFRRLTKLPEITRTPNCSV